MYTDYITRANSYGVQIDGMTDFRAHSVRRRPWVKALSSASLKNYEAMLRDTLQLLVGTLSSRAGMTTDISEWMTYFTFDFMGDMAYVSYRFCASETDGLILTLQRFGQSFSMLTSGYAEERWDIVERFSM